MKLITRLVLASVVCSFASADTIRLRDGSEYEGIVVAEEEDEYVVMVQVTKTIRDERRFKKTDVLEIVGEKKDEKAFEEIKDLVPVPDGLTKEQYESRIDKVEGFLEQFPDSGRLTREAKKIHDTLFEESKVIAAGGVKFDGKLIPASEKAANAYTLDAQMVATELKEHADAGRRVEALRAWDLLQKDYLGSRAFLSALPVIQNVAARQLSAVENELESFDERVAERQESLQRVPERDRDRIESAIQAEGAAYLRKVAEEEEKGIRWLSLDPFQEDQLEDAKRLLEREVENLERLDTSRLPQPDTAWSEAWKTLNGNPTREEAREAYSSARSAELPERYLQMLEAKMPEN